MPETVIERLLNEVRDGQDGARERLFEAVYTEMRRIAATCFRGNRGSHTLTPTAVVHEAWMKLSGNATTNWDDRRHFYASAAKAMRHVLIDYARARGSLKRGGGRIRVPIDAADLAATGDSEQIMALEEALTRLEEWNAELAEIVRLRYYAGLTGEQAAEVMGLTLRTFNRRWSLARGWLAQEIEQGSQELESDDE